MMSGEVLAKIALVLGIVFAGVVLALFSTWDPGAITAFVGGLAGVATALWFQLKATQEVHKIVNQQRTDMLAHQAVLESTLRSAGVAVPKDKSLDVTKRAA